MSIRINLNWVRFQNFHSVILTIYYVMFHTQHVCDWPWIGPGFKIFDHSHSLSFMSCFLPSVCVTGSFQSFSPFTTVLTSFSLEVLPFQIYLMVSDQHMFGWPQHLFPSTSKSKICPVYSCFTCPNQRGLLQSNYFQVIYCEFILLTRTSASFRFNRVASGL